MSFRVECRRGTWPPLSCTASSAIHLRKFRAWRRRSVGRICWPPQQNRRGARMCRRPRLVATNNKGFPLWHLRFLHFCPTRARTTTLLYIACGVHFLVDALCQSVAAALFWLPSKAFVILPPDPPADDVGRCDGFKTCGGSAQARSVVVDCASASAWHPHGPWDHLPLLGWKGLRLRAQGFALLCKAPHSQTDETLSFQTVGREVTAPTVDWRTTAHV